jgi:lipopolysaccharide export system permease protein
MRLIDRYLLRQMLGPTLLATAALTAVALLSQSLAGLDLIVNQRQSAVVFLKITLLYMPQLINMILPSTGSTRSRRSSSASPAG